MARKGFSGAVFCGCSTLRDGARAEGTGHVEECQAMWSHEHIHKHSSELCPSQNCSPMKYLGFWMLLIPYCPPQQVHFRCIIYGCPLLLLDVEKGRSDPRPEEGLSLPCGPEAQDPSLTFHTILPTQVRRVSLGTER